MEILVSEPWVADPLRGNVRLTAIGEGDLLAPGHGLSHRSDDGGRSWVEAPEARCVCSRRDGSVISLVRNRCPGAQRGLLEPEGEPPWRRFHLDLAVSTDGWQTVQRMPSVIQTLDVTPRASDGGSLGNPPGIMNVLELEGGRLVASIDGALPMTGGKCLVFARNLDTLGSSRAMCSW